jgi:NitT/TauT family transport system substrate-binding protein
MHMRLNAPIRRLVGPAGLVLLAAAPIGFAYAQKPPMATVRVAAQPLTNFTPLLIAKEKGWFAEENLNVTWTMITQAAVAVEAVFGGSAELGGGGILEPMIARGNGLDISFAVAGCRVRTKPPDNFGLFVRDGDPIRTPADLVGKRVSAGLINSVSYIHTVAWLRKNGVDPKSVQFLELPLPQMADALLNNRIDAGWVVEPFLTVMMQSGKARALAHPYHTNVPGMDITAYFAKESWLRANADTARRFKRAIDRATAVLTDGPKEERHAWIAKFSGVRPELVDRMTLPLFTSEFNVESLQANLELAVGQGLSKSFDVKTMVWRP